MISKTDREQLKAAHLFRDLSDDVLDLLLERARIQTVGKDETLFRIGDEALHFFAVLDGWVKLVRDNAAGEEAVLHIFGAGDTFAEAAMFMGREYPATAITVEGSRLCVFSRSVMESVVRETPEVCLAFLGAVSLRLKAMVNELEQLKTRNGEQRLAKFLADLCGGRLGACEVRLPYDKSLIALRLSMRPESLSRHLSKLEGVGVHGNGQAIMIDDVQRLRDFVE